MKLITERTLIRGVADAWARQYPERSGDEAEIKRKLISLDKETATSEEIKEIIGNDSWTSITCDECGNSVSLVVQVGQEPDYESNTAALCADCLTAAYGRMIKRDEATTAVVIYRSGLFDKKGREICLGDTIEINTPYRSTQTHYGENIPRPDCMYTEPLEPEIKTKRFVVKFGEGMFHIEDANNAEYGILTPPFLANP